MARFNSSSTSKTLVGSEDGLVSPLASPLGTLDRKLLAANPIVQTADSKEWLDLDSVSPKLLRELRRQYDPSCCEEKGPLAKSAARIKAWSRSTKRGLEIRLRRKVSQEHDVVTDFRLFINSTSEDEPLSLPEMPCDNAIYELPDTSAIPELSTDSDAARRDSIGSTGEALPRYEPTVEASLQERPRLRIVPAENTHASVDHGHSSSQSSIVSTPTEGLPVRAVEKEKEDAEDMSDHRSADVTGGLQSELSGTASPTGQTRENSNNQEELQILLKALKEHLANQPQHQALAGSDHLGIETTARYETETDVEPPSPSKATKKKSISSRVKSTATACSGKPPMPRPKPQVLKKASPKIDPTEGDLEMEDASLPRRLTIPQKISKKAGAEAVWARVLQTQGKILGAEHPLVFEGRHALSLSRVQKHRNCSRALLSSLYQTEEVAKQTLGRHPFVQTFAADFKTLRFLILNSNDRQGISSTVGSDEISKEAENSMSPTQEGEPALLNPQPRSGDIYAARPRVDSPQAHSPQRQTPRIQTTFVDSNGEARNVEAEPQLPEQDLWNTWRSPHQPRHDAVILSGLIFASVTSMLKRGIDWLERSCGPEPPVEAGKVRVKWTCSCGDQLYDDFTELRPGAARALEAYLNRPRTRTGGGSPTTPSSAGGRSFNGSLNSSVGGTSSTQTSWTSYGGSSKGSPVRDTKRSQTAASLPQYTFTPLDEPPWLLTCANEDRFIPKVAHLDMSRHKITSDKDLAKALREHYFEINRKWWKRLKLRGLTTIEFVQFECHQNRYPSLLFTHAITQIVSNCFPVQTDSQTFGNAPTCLLTVQESTHSNPAR